MTRNIECEFEIAASPEEVWQALVHADHICRWFAPFADSAPGPDGFVSLGWKDADHLERMDVLTWLENEKLILDWRAAPPGQEPAFLPVEFTLVREGRTTRLKLVQNGFLSDASWDDEYESHHRGWQTELRFLKYYLEHHLGKVRNLFKARMPIDPEDDIIPRVVGPGGVFRTDGMPQVGQRFQIRLPDGKESSCELLYVFGKTDFVFICDALDGGIVRIALEYLSSDPTLLLWAYSWNLVEDKVMSIAKPWFDEVLRSLEKVRTE